MRTAAAIIAAASLVLPVAAFGASPPSGGPGGATNAGAAAASQLLAFSRCMRSHGVPNFPDPQAGAINAKFPGPQQLGVSDSLYQAGVKACQHLLPAGIGDRFPPAEARLVLIGMLKFSGCMRHHGVPNWPDPILDSQGRPVFDLGRAGISRRESRSPRLAAKFAACHHLLPRALPGIPVGGP
jgi:hypothetical protein